MASSTQELRPISMREQINLIQETSSITSTAKLNPEVIVLFACRLGRERIMSLLQCSEVLMRHNRFATKIIGVRNC